MNKFARMLYDIDERVDKGNDRFFAAFSHYFPIISGAILGTLLLLFAHQIITERPFLYTALIQSDLERISKSLNFIDEQCAISDIKYDRLAITFLSSAKEAMAERAGLVLEHPEKWDGPYSIDNPTVQARPYELLRAADGYYLVPGNGVKLPNGKIMGQDIIITAQTMVDDMLKDNGDLNYEGYMLARPLLLGVSEENQPVQPHEHLNKMLNEFNDAYPYAYNHTVPQQTQSS